MRKKVGVSAIQKKQAENQQFSKVGKALEETKLSFVQDVLVSFKKSLAEFAAKHKGRINSDPEFRQQFHTMCVSAGVDPLASGKGLWSDVLGVGDFYFELGVKIIQISVKTRSANGGIMSLKEMHEHVTAMTPNQQQVTVDDMRRSIDKLAVLGGGFKVVQIAGNPMVISVPIEINTDHEFIFEAAMDEGGYVTENIMRSLHGWSRDRFEIIMNPLLQEGIVWVDDFHGTC